MPEQKKQLDAATRSEIVKFMHEHPHYGKHKKAHLCTELFDEVRARFPTRDLKKSTMADWFRSASFTEDHRVKRGRVAYLDETDKLVLAGAMDFAAAKNLAVPSSRLQEIVCSRISFHPSNSWQVAATLMQNSSFVNRRLTYFNKDRVSPFYIRKLRKDPSLRKHFKRRFHSFFVRPSSLLL